MAIIIHWIGVCLYAVRGAFQRNAIKLDYDSITIIGDSVLVGFGSIPFLVSIYTGNNVGIGSPIVDRHN